MMIAAKNASDYMIGLPRIERRLFEQLFQSIGPAPIRFVLPDGNDARGDYTSPDPSPASALTHCSSFRLRLRAQNGSPARGRGRHSTLKPAL